MRVFWALLGAFGLGLMVGCSVWERATMPSPELGGEVPIEEIAEGAGRVAVDHWDIEGWMAITAGILALFGAGVGAKAVANRRRR